MLTDPPMSPTLPMTFTIFLVPCGDGFVRMVLTRRLRANGAITGSWFGMYFMGEQDADYIKYAGDEDEQ